MATKKIKKGDLVKIIAGKDKGKQGKVLLVKDEKVLVEGINMITKHTKPSQSNPKGGIVHQEAMLNISNVMYLHKGTPTRIGFRMVEGKNGMTKVRIAKATGEAID